MNTYIKRWIIAVGYTLLIFASIFVFLYVCNFFSGTFNYSPLRKPPLNVIILTVDTFRPDHSGCYGYRHDTTPFLDTIAKKGVIFRNVVSSAPWTSPGIISLFTGLYPSVHGVTARNQSLLPGTETIFDVFVKHGYTAPNISYITNIPNFFNLGLSATEKHSNTSDDRPGTELFNWLSGNRDNKFIAWYHYRFLHLPYDPKSNIFLDEQMKALIGTENIKKIQKQVIIPKGSLAFTTEEHKVVNALYDAQLRDFDDFMKNLYEHMVRLKLDQNTLLVISADHGEELFEHGFIGHASTAINATMYDEVLKIPLILYAPGFLKPGTVIKKQVRQVDIMPTIINIMDMPLPDQVQGISLLPLVREHRDMYIPPALSESNLGGFQSTEEQEKIQLRSIRTDDWKLICMYGEANGVCELFDLRNDPGETKNVISREKEVAASLTEQLDAAFTQMEAHRLKMLTEEKISFSESDIPEGAVLEKPLIIQPQNGETIIIKNGGQILLRWTGDNRITHVIEYDVGESVRKLKGKIPVKGTKKTFGPLPEEAWRPLPYWNPYRIRIAPYGNEKYWSEWTTFFIDHEKG